jgi:hypothetical protein
MKTLRILLVLAAVLSLGLAVFASVRANITTATSIPTIRVADDGGDSLNIATWTQSSIRVADDGGDSLNVASGCVSGQVA